MAGTIPSSMNERMKHYNVVHVFKEGGRSGYTGEIRPGFEDMLNYLGQGQADVLLTRHHDRPTRNPDDFAQLMHVCGKAKIKISLYTGGDLDLSAAKGGFAVAGLYWYASRSATGEPEVAPTESTQVLNFKLPDDDHLRVGWGARSRNTCRQNYALREALRTRAISWSG